MNFIDYILQREGALVPESLKNAMPPVGQVFNES